MCAPVQERSCKECSLRTAKPPAQIHHRLQNYPRKSGCRVRCSGVGKDEGRALEVRVGGLFLFWLAPSAQRVHGTAWHGTAQHGRHSMAGCLGGSARRSQGITALPPCTPSLLGPCRAELSSSTRHSSALGQGLRGVPGSACCSRCLLCPNASHSEDALRWHCSFLPAGSWCRCETFLPIPLRCERDLWGNRNSGTVDEPNDGLVTAEPVLSRAVGTGRAPGSAPLLGEVGVQDEPRGSAVPPRPCVVRCLPRGAQAGCFPPGPVLMLCCSSGSSPLQR